MKQEIALKLLKTGSNIFLTGSAGSGKTHVLNQYIQYLKARKVSVAITASTGIAATHMNGMTIHTWSGIGIKDELNEQDLKNLYQRKYLREHIEHAEVLLIDEISMLHAKQFNVINQVLQFFKANHEPFGGIQIIVSGDFFQLPPVSKNNEANRDKFAFMSEAWVEAKFQVCYLTEQYRQNDNQLTDILNAIRCQRILPEHIHALLKTKEQQKIDIITKLYTHNADVDALNLQHLVNIKGKIHCFSAELKGNEKLLETLKSSVRTPELLELKKNAKVMFVKNNFAMGYANGSVGDVVGFVEDPELGKLPEVKLSNGEKIVVEPETWSINDEQDTVLASFKQIPLRLAWAMTIHKSQGMTLDQAEIDLSKTFECGQGYVALSRLKSLDGLRLIDFKRHALELDSLAVKADKRFQELSEQCEQQFEAVDLTTQQEAFIRRCGGTLNQKEIIVQEKKLTKQNNAMKNTYVETLALFEAGYDIEEIATERQLTLSTVMNHLAYLAKTQHLNLDRLRPEESLLEPVRKQVKKLQKRADPDDMNEDGSLKLRPIVEATKLGYTEVRLALLFIV